MINVEKKEIAVIGLVLVLAVEFGKKFNVVGFDIDYVELRSSTTGMTGLTSQMIQNS